MATKSNLKSVRLSDDLIELIERQVGDTFTAKLENLVTRCVWELPRKEEEIKQLEERIESRKSDLRQLSERARSYEQALNNMKWDMQSLGNAISKAAKMCNTD